MPKIFITRRIPEAGIKLLKEKGYKITINPEDRVLSKEELVENLKNKNYDAVLCLLTDKIDDEVFEAAGPQCKIFANFAVGIDNIDIEAAARRGVAITNTPGVLTEAVAEHTIALLFSISRKIVEADKFIRQGKFKGWEPELLLGTEITNKALGIIGLGRIGTEVAKRMHNGFNLKIIYYDIVRHQDLEKEFGLEYKDLPDLLKEADFISIHVPLILQTKHLIGEKELKIMKPTAYLINTSRGAVINEKALVMALKQGIIAGAALDVFENEPNLTEGLKELDNVILTPHIASATIETRTKMSELAAQNIIAALEEKEPPNLVKE